MVKQNATFLGASNTLVPIGSDHAYAFGGVIPVTNANEKILSFTTGKKYLKCRLSVTNGSGSGDDIKYTVLLNGTTTCQWYYNTVGDTSWDNLLYLIIPPLTNVAIHADNVASSTPRDHTCWLEGRLYA